MPRLVFLMETKKIECQMELVLRKLGFSGGFSNGRDGMAGGLALLWQKDVQVTIRSFSQGHIDVIIGGLMNATFQFTSFYGNQR